ncbi:G-type lectin S-receptor-like serine/threonine-protein kinase CES101 [Fagus crenata]
MIDEFGRLIISHSGGSVFVSNSVPAENNATASAMLLDSGNFILMEQNSDGSTRQNLWQSFDYPTDTLLPGMKLGMGLKTTDRWSLRWSLTSWISENNPAKGNAYWTSGNWQNGHFEFVPRLSNDGYNNFSLISNENEMYFTYSLNKNHNLSRYMIDSTGAILEITGLAPFGGGPCSYGSYTGCFMSGEGFKFDGNYNLSLFDCREKCMNNCSCIAYAFTENNQTSCTIWSKGVNFKENNYSYSQEIYVLIVVKAKWWIWFVPSLAGFVALLVLCVLYNFIQRKIREKGKSEAEQEILLCELGVSTANSSRSRKRKVFKRGKKVSVLQFFSYESIAAATNNFATTCKLGEGGFGPVYKGKLADGQEVAIKRLSKNSGQGVVEFKNEIILIAKLQHTNLVRLVGCCIQREEKMLIYEYMHNKSLDLFLFDPMKKDLLDWTKRFNIIEAIAQGLLYLHKYSRLRIIHRDLKASNILLDATMNPKISDFGMARMFGQDQSEENTKRVVGTLVQKIGPPMSDVVSMITNETLSLVPPKQPAYFINRSLPEIMLEDFSINKVSISEMEAR